MLEENARVREVRDDMVVVETLSKSACNDCGTKTGCGTGLLSELFKPKKADFSLKNTLNLQVGDQVVIAISESGLLRGALLVYLLPLLAMFISAMLVGIYVGPENDVATLVAGAVGFGMAMVWLRSQYGRQAQTMNAHPILLRRIDSLSPKSTAQFR